MSLFSIFEKPSWSYSRGVKYNLLQMKSILSTDRPKLVENFNLAISGVETLLSISTNWRILSLSIFYLTLRSKKFYSILYVILDSICILNFWKKSE